MQTDTAVECFTTAASLRAAPYELEWGASVFAQVLAINVYGDSDFSLEGNGAVIITSPGEPTALSEDAGGRAKTTLGLTWTAPEFTGGDVILDYRVNYRVLGGEFTPLASDVTETSYTAAGLSLGTQYEFRVESRNNYGYSLASSNTLLLLCAVAPEPPATVQTSNFEDQVKL